MTYNYLTMKHILNEIEFTQSFPDQIFLEREGISIDSIKPEPNKSGQRIKGHLYKPEGKSKFLPVIVQNPGGGSEFRFSENKSTKKVVDAVKEFKAKIERAKEAYKKTGRGIFEEELRSETSSILNDDDNNSEQTVVKKLQELEELDQMIEEEM